MQNVFVFARLYHFALAMAFSYLFYNMTYKKTATTNFERVIMTEELTKAEVLSVLDLVRLILRFAVATGIPHDVSFEFLE
jgi:hypothetical protein